MKRTFALVCLSIACAAASLPAYSAQGATAAGSNAASQGSSARGDVCHLDGQDGMPVLSCKTAQTSLVEAPLRAAPADQAATVLASAFAGN